MKQYVYGHRGASGYAPENTLRAFALAAEQGADGVELDAQLTKDGRLVVFHDETLDRVTDGHGFLCEYTYKELQQYPITKANGADGTDTIPLLRDVLLLLKEKGLKVNIELKNSELPYEGMEELILQLVKECGMEENTLYSSFNHYSMVKIKQLQPTAKCGLLYWGTILAYPWNYAQQLGMDAIHPEKTELTIPGEAKGCHQLGIEVNPWTVNEEKDLQMVIENGADRIITNYPDRARAMLDKYGKEA